MFLFLVVFRFAVTFMDHPLTVGLLIAKPVFKEGRRPALLPVHVLLSTLLAYPANVLVIIGGSGNFG